MPETPTAIFPFPIRDARPLVLAGAAVDVSDRASFEAYLADQRGTAPALIGGYGEYRGIYAGSALFGEETGASAEPRVIHLGVDVWAEAGTPLRSPLDGVVHSFADNAALGDYGGTIILEHQGPYWTLWGHLSRLSLAGLQKGRGIPQGKIFAWLGAPAENGGWPPHLHLQKISDMMGRSGDFPGVAKQSERARWLDICPDPSHLLV